MRRFKGKTRRSFCVLSLLLLACVIWGGIAVAATPVDPYKDKWDVYIRDSLLAFYGGKLSAISLKEWTDGVNSVSDVASLIEARNNVDISDVNTASGSEPTPMAVSGVYDEGDRVLGLANYGSTGYRKFQLKHINAIISENGKLDMLASGLYSTNAEDRDFSPTDVVAYDVNGDGYDDFIVGEIERQRKKNGNIDPENFKFFIKVYDGKPFSGERKFNDTTHTYRYQIKADDGTTIFGGKSPSVRLAVGDFYGDGKKRLAVTYCDMGAGKSSGTYRLSILSFPSDAKGKKIGTLKLNNDNGIYNRSLGEARDDRNCHDVAVGRFGASGRDEIMAIVVDKAQDKQSTHYLHATSANAWTATSATLKSSTDQNNNCDDAIAVAADLDQCGRDELVWVIPQNPGGNNKIMMGLSRVNNSGNIENMSPVRDIVVYVDPDALRETVSIAAGSFTGRSFSAANQQWVGEVAMMYLSKDRKNVYIDFYSANADGTGRAASLSKLHSGAGYRIHNSGSDLYPRPILLAGDFYGNSMRLRNPQYVGEATVLVPHTILQVPPKHYDVVTQANGKKTTVNTFFDSLKSMSTASSTTTKASSASSQVDGAISSSYSHTSHGKIKTTTKFENKSQNSLKKVNEAFSKTLTEVTGEVAITDDRVLSYEEKRQYWRYDMEGVYVEDENGDLINAYFDVAVPVEVQQIDYYSVNIDGVLYNPVHERLNVLSYPSELAHTRDYKKELLASTPTTATLDGSGLRKRTVTWGETFESGTGNETAVNYKSGTSTTVSLPSLTQVVGKLASMYAGKPGSIKQPKNEYNKENTQEQSYESASTESQAWNDQSGMAFEVPMVHGLNGASYTIRGQAMRMPNDAVQLAFAADLSREASGGLETVWNETDGVYSRQDPALNLPFKYARDGSVTPAGTDANSANIPVIETKPQNALKLRGVRFTTTDDTDFTSIRPEDPANQSFIDPFTLPKDAETCRVKVPVYNYSTATDVASVTVRLRMAEISRFGAAFVMPENISSFAVTKDVVLTGIPYHQKGKENWVYADFDIDCTNLAEKDYRIFVEVDPDDAIADETHERWDATTDPNGNNLGYIDVYVRDYTDVAASRMDALFETGTMRAEGDVPAKLQLAFNDLPDLSGMSIQDAIDNYRGIDMTFDFFYDEGPEMIYGITLRAYIQPDDGSPRRGVAMRHVPAMKRGVRYEIQAPILRVLLAEIASKRGNLVIQTLGDRDDIDTSLLNREGLISFNEEPARGGGSGGCDAGAGALLALCVVGLVARRRRES